MGLRDYREYKRRKELIALIDELGLKNVVSELKELKDKVAKLTERVSELENNSVKFTELSKDEEKRIREKYEGATTPQDFVKMFADENVEYLPNAYGTKQAEQN